MLDYNLISLIAGIIIALIGILTIFLRFDVSIGHSIILGAAVVILVLPQTSSFEFTGDGVKVITREVALETAEEIKKIREQQASLIGSLKDIVSEQETILMNSSMAQSLNDTYDSEENIDLRESIMNTGGLENIKKQLESESKSNDLGIKRLEELQEKIYQNWNK
ncbi:hypothetical protein [Fodinicurvata fenggangensis]|uniref:hypothetical protein n=1 Tax=Fodinicurvata fenggangensis TaxID=1121830 RepID=UPI00047DE8EF|nr:hypothetical protein [Fodinicurvata fenggangensis]